MRLFFVFIIAVTVFSGSALAQDDNLGQAITSLQDVLSTLKDSTEKLSVDNDQLRARDRDIQQKILQLQTQLQRLRDQGDVLNKQAARLQEQNPGRGQQILRLQDENSDLDSRIKKDEDIINVLQKSLDEGYKQYQKLLLQLKSLTSQALPYPDQSPQAQAAAHLEKEKLVLMKMIGESQQRQESLHQAILEFQKHTTQPAAVALVRQQLLKGQIRDLKAQISAYPMQNAANAGDNSRWDDAQLHQLESELMVLEHNYAQLKSLMGPMSQKAKETAGQRMENEKLQGNLDDLDRQGEGLKADLDELRSEMIELDKRKSHLEEMIQQMH